MKKKDWLLIISAIIFSVLFYKQLPGLNFLVATVLFAGLVAWYNPQQTKQMGWWYYTGLSIVGGLSVFICNSALSIFATLISLLVLSGKTYNAKNTIFVNLTFGMYSLLSSPVHFILDVNKRRTQQQNAAGSGKNKIYIGVPAALVVSVIFFALYQQANPLFKDFTNKINLSWISIGWCIFTVVGFFVIYGLLFYRDIGVVSDWDLQANYTIKNKESESTEVSGNTVIALTLFVLLNIMLIFLNALDVNNLFITKKLPDGITLSDFVHNAVSSLVVSILIAVGFITWFFKNELNFNKQSKKLKLLVYLWIAQSALMVMSAMIRNCWYIESYQLTYLRIGVYLFLFLSFVGLLFTFLKVQQAKSGWYLVRQNFEAWLLILVLCALVNWDKLITTYNISHTKNYQRLDTTYLVDLSDAGLSPLTEVMFNNVKTTSLKDENFQRLSLLLYHSNKRRHEVTWQNFNLRVRDLDLNIQKLLNEKKISLLALDLKPDVMLSDLSDFHYLSALSLKNTPPDFERIAFFKQLQHLSFESVNKADLTRLILNKNLKHLEVSKNLYGYQNLDPFKHLRSLEQLDLPDISNEGLLQLNHHPSLKVLTLKTLYQDQIGFIKAQHLSFTVKEAEHEKQ